MKNKNTENHNEFKIPENYFNTIEDRVFEKLSEKKLLKNDEFNIPKNYFETVEDSVFEKLNLTHKKETKVISIRRLLIQISVAAALIFMASLFYINNNSTNINTITANDVDIWLDENVEDIDTFLIAEIFEADEIDDLQNFNDADLLNELEGADIGSILDELDANY